MKKVFETAQLGNLQLKNRLIRSATWEGLGNQNGAITQHLLDICRGLAAGGVGAIVCGFTSVSEYDYRLEDVVRLSNDTLIESHRQLPDLVHEYDCTILPQIALGYYNRVGAATRETDIPVDLLTKEDIDRIREMFVDTACRAEKAGYDGVQIHAAHRFFLSRFISPSYNHRKDEYGGPAESRGKIIVEIVRAIRQECPQLHISMKINSYDDGLTPEDSLIICKMCADAGLNSVEVSGTGTMKTGVRPGVNEAYFKEFAIKLGQMVDIPVILVGGHRSLSNMEHVLNEGRIDFLSLSRPLIREPDLPNLLRSGKSKTAKCVSCNQCLNTPGHVCIFNLK